MRQGCYREIEMGKSKPERVEPYVMVEHYQMDSAAWTALSDRAVWLYLELRKQFKKAQGGDSHLILPYSEVRWRMSRTSFCNGMAELCHYGFIKLVEAGGLLRRPSIYAISQGWLDVSCQIVNEEGREAIRLGLAKKPSSRNNFKNLKGSRR
jgi:hypothetical protein